MATSVKNTLGGGDNKVNNVWKRIKRRYIYRNGVQSEPLVTFHWDNGSSYNPQGATTFYDSYIHSVCSKTDIRQGAITDSTIDLSNYDSLSMSCAISTDNAVHGFVGVSNDKTTVSSSGTRMVLRADGTVNAVVTYDTSSITTVQYVVFGASSGWASTNVGEVKTYSVWLDSGAWEYVTDKNENKYPDGDILGEYYYERVSVDVGPIMNLLVPALGTTTDNGVTCVNNGDGTYTVDGTSTGTSTFVIGTIPSATWNTLVGNAKLIGCPNGGSLDSYVLFTVGSFGNGNFCQNAKGVTIANTSTSDVSIRIQIKGEVTNLTFKPMLVTNLKATYRDFEKGVAEGITPQAFDCTRMVKSTFVPTATGSIYSIYPNIPHNFGSKPKVLIMGIRDKSKYSPIGNTLCWWIAEGLTSNYSYMIGFRATTDGGRARNINQTSGFVLGDTYLTVTSSATSTGAIYLIGGETYDIIAMA